jgi:cell division septation protein DedD
VAAPAPRFVAPVATPVVRHASLLRRASTPAAPRPLMARADYVRASGGRWAVQLGAFSTATSIDKAWDRVSGRVRPIAGMTPHASTFRYAGATYQRLSVTGLASRAEALTLCARIRRTGSACFVRQSTNEAPIQWARRASAGRVAAS